MQRLKEQVLTLSDSGPAELAHELIQRLDAPSDKGVDEVRDTLSAACREQQAFMVLNQT